MTKLASVPSTTLLPESSVIAPKGKGLLDNWCSESLIAISKLNFNHNYSCPEDFACRQLVIQASEKLQVLDGNAQGQRLGQKQTCAVGK